MNIVRNPMKTQTKVAWVLFALGALLMCCGVVLESWHFAGVSLVILVSSVIVGMNQQEKV